MQDAIEFRNYAEECLRLAEVVSPLEDKAVLLSMAQAWILLADKAASINALLNEGKS
jgi:hypothetical protein